jgi:hypothetical protein
MYQVGGFFANLATPFSSYLEFDDRFVDASNYLYGKLPIYLTYGRHFFWLDLGMEKKPTQWRELAIMIPSGVSGVN